MSDIFSNPEQSISAFRDFLSSGVEHAPPAKKEVWLETPVGPEEWPYDGEPPCRRDFANWLAQDQKIIDFPRQQGLWSAVMSSAIWAVPEDSNRRQSMTVKKRLNQIEHHATKLLETLSSVTDPLDREPSNHKVDMWLNELIKAAEFTALKDHPPSEKLSQTGTVRVIAREGTKDMVLLSGTDDIVSHLKLLLLLTQQLKRQLGVRATPSRRGDHVAQWAGHLTPSWALYTGSVTSAIYKNNKPKSAYARFMHKAADMIHLEERDRLQSVITPKKAATPKG